MQDLSLWLQKHVSVVYLPSYEFFFSLHVLGSPEHHTHRTHWAEEMLASLPPQLVKDLPYYNLLSNNFMEVVDYILPWMENFHTSVEAGLERINALTPEEFVEAMIGPIYHHNQIREWMQGKADETFEQLKPEHRELIRRPLQEKRGFMEFCYAYLPFFQQEERRIEPWLIRAVHEGMEQLQEDPLRFLSEIHPRFKLHDEFVLFHKAKTYQFFYRDLKRIYLYASSFISPHLMLGILPNHIVVGLHVEVPGTAQPSIPADFIKKMSVFSDPTRSAILKSLLQHPYCIQQLASLHRVSEPAVVKHVKLLLDCGFVWGERRGRYVFYRAISTKLEQLAVDIHEFIDMPDPTLTDRRK